MTKSVNKKYRKDIDIKHLRHLWCRGYTAEDIGLVFGVSPQTVKIRARELGLSRPKKKKTKNTLCKTCKYGAFISGGKSGVSHCCDYFLITGTRRNCEYTDEHCDKYEKGRKLKTDAGKRYNKGSLASVQYEYDFIDHRKWR